MGYSSRLGEVRKIVSIGFLSSCQQNKELDTIKFVDFSFKARTHVLKSYRDISRVVFEIQVLKIRSFFKILQKVKKYTFLSQILELGEYGVNPNRTGGGTESAPLS